MHLSYSFSRYRGRKYKSYAIAESYREGKKVKKRTIWPIGKLTDQQAEQIKLVLKVAQGKGQFITQLKDIVVKDSRAYRDKTKIEDVFKNVKSFLKIRPFFVNTEKHVKAVYTICILAYFLNKFLANQRKAVGEKDYLNSKELYAPFKDIDSVTLFDRISGETVTKSVELPEETRIILGKIGMPHVASSQ